MGRYRGAHSLCLLFEISIDDERSRQFGKLQKTRAAVCDEPHCANDVIAMVFHQVSDGKPRVIKDQEKRQIRFREGGAKASVWLARPDDKVRCSGTHQMESEFVQRIQGSTVDCPKRGFGEFGNEFVAPVRETIWEANRE
jgi:hypothetical protein